MNRLSNSNKPQQPNPKIESPEINDNPFECNICLDTSQEPVITQCGHIYCWACIYSWLNSNQEFLSCPVCKNGIKLDNLISLYTKNDNQNEESKQNPNGYQNVPPRPRQQRQQPIRNQNAIGNGSMGMNSNSRMNIQQGVLLAGYGFFPSIFCLMFQVGNKIDDSDMEQQSPEIQYQKYFKAIIWLLFIITIFVLVQSVIM